MTNYVHNSFYQFCSTLFYLSALQVSNESIRSSSGARHNILYYTVWYNRAGKSSCFEVVGKTQDSQCAGRHSIPTAATCKLKALRLELISTV